MISMRLSWLAVPVLNTLYQFFIKHGAAQLDGAAGADWLWQALASHWILAAIASEIAPMPPITCPQAPFTPFSSPSAWWSRL